MRGARRRGRTPHAPGRIIPADAGSTSLTADDIAITGDHPRGCGEHAPSRRMRWTRGRIIPADAGSTETGWDFTIPGQDHPRGCGEHKLTWLTMRPARGSSPRMRGAQSQDEFYNVPIRIIPADAGSTYLVSNDKDAVWDHPRGCGEHSFPSVHIVSLSGSSPRMRGAQERRIHVTVDGRIIPADAGSTRPLTNPGEGVTDHPRGCGEHKKKKPLYKRVWGSSPRMRGARRHRQLHEQQDGIIPADAGSTSSYSSESTV